MRFNIQLKDKKAMEELLPLIDEVKRADGLVVGELGALTGRSSKIFAEKVSALGGVFIVIDHFEGSKVGERYVAEGGTKDRFVAYMSGQKYVLFPVESGVAASLIKDKIFDFLWIDADHRYHAIKRDLDLWLPKMRDGGIISGHDYEGPEFKEEFIEEDFVEGKHHGVIKAVNERFKEINRANTNWWVRV